MHETVDRCFVFISIEVTTASIVRRAVVSYFLPHGTGYVELLDTGLSLSTLLNAFWKFNYD
jgi:hypothetical protein